MSTEQEYAVQWAGGSRPVRYSREHAERLAALYPSAVVVVRDDKESLWRPVESAGSSTQGKGVT